MAEPPTNSTAPGSYAVPPARELKRERKALLEVREERLRDLEAVGAAWQRFHHAL